MDRESPYAPSPLHSFAEWLDGHAWSTALHESLLAYPLLNSTHVLTVMLFVGLLLMVDLRMLGVAFKETPVSELTSRLLPWTVVGFVVMFVSGLLLFYAIPVRTGAQRLVSREGGAAICGRHQRVGLPQARIQGSRPLG